MTDDREIVLRGKIVFPPGDRPAEAERVVASIEDVSHADAPAELIARHVQEKVTVPQDEKASLLFAIGYPASVDPRSRYAVRVHVDVTGTETVTPGDFVSTVSYPVSPEPGEVTVRVQRV
jgi:uncharacterized lipoprotein YbaY